MNILAIDLETTGFDEKKDVITEIGAVAFSWNAPGDITQLFSMNNLVYDQGQPEQSPFIEALTGITNVMLKEKGQPLHASLTELRGIMGNTSPAYFMAHNKAFDEKFFKEAVEKYPDTSELLGIPWLCTLNDMEHPKEFKSRKLSHLALDYGCTVNPKTLHRAVADVSLMIDMIKESRVDLLRLIERMGQPSIFVRAIVPKPFGPGNDGGKGKDKAALCGFRWNGKIWVKEIKENEYEKTKEDLGYEIAIVQN